MQYHPTQLIAKGHESLFSKAILESLAHPQLMVGELPNSTCFKVSLPDLVAADSAGAPLLSFNQKLGHLYEDALGKLLEDDPRFGVLKKNFQIITSERQTVGEIDFLLWDERDQQHIHLELAVKFYLIYQDKNEICYPGPDARDNYGRKITRLRKHQLQLSRHPAAAAQIEGITGSAPLRVNHLVHGIFFDHIGASDKPTPEFANPEGRRRSWLYCSELSEYFSGTKTARVLPKQLWLCEIDSDLYNALVEIPVAELLELGQQRCTMFVLEPSSEPLFLAPDHWPDQL
ncbi:MAG: hypothetical protein ACI9FG_000777 [Crocinitomicaceae bacterium]|jgi:hypothetical protein